MLIYQPLIAPMFSKCNAMQNSIRLLILNIPRDLLFGWILGTLKGTSGVYSSR